MLIDSEETYKILCEAYPLLQKDYLRRVIDEVPSAEVKGDLISRAEAIARATHEGAYGYISAQELADMPSAERVGEWVYHTEPLPYRPYGYYTCSLCNEMSWDESNYCPNCGARMEGEQNE